MCSTLAPLSYSSYVQQIVEYVYVKQSQAKKLRTFTVIVGVSVCRRIITFCPVYFLAHDAAAKEKALFVTLLK